MRYFNLLGKFRSLPRLEKRIIFTAAYLLPLCAFGLRTVGFQRTRDLLVGDLIEVAPRGVDEELAIAFRVAHAVDIAATYGLYRANCLKRSLVLCRFLRQQGISSELKIGAALTDGDFSAHAWVVSGDVVLNDGPDVIDRFGTLEPH